MKEPLFPGLRRVGRLSVSEFILETDISIVFSLIYSEVGRSRMYCNTGSTLGQDGASTSPSFVLKIF